jgi:hypothetical protein
MTKRWLSYLSSLRVSDLLKGTHLAVDRGPPISGLYSLRLEKFWSWVDMTVSRGASLRMVLLRHPPVGPVTMRVSGRQTEVKFEPMWARGFTPFGAMRGIQSDFWFRHGSSKERVPSLRQAFARFERKVAKEPMKEGRLAGLLPDLLLKKFWSVADLTPYGTGAVYGLGTYKGSHLGLSVWTSRA